VPSWHRELTNSDVIVTSCYLHYVILMSKAKTSGCAFFEAFAGQPSVN
jgi:hypothetical protein